MNLLPKLFNLVKKSPSKHLSFQNTNAYSALKRVFKTKKNGYIVGILLDVVCLVVVGVAAISPVSRLISPLFRPLAPLQPLTEGKGGYEVFGFAPYWTFNKLDNVDFNVLTTFAYFGIEVNPTGDLELSGTGYETFKSQKATDIFKTAHNSGTRVVLTITQMDNSNIKALMDDPIAQQKAIDQSVALVKERGIDGINVDFEYSGNPGSAYRQKYSQFVANLTSKMHREVPSSRVTVSVYASAVKDPKIYDIAALSQSTDGIFMMAYDFAVAGSGNAIPTAPLYGYKEGKYWYDISTAVDDFLKEMPADKLILGVPYYGYNYMVYQPEVKAETRPNWTWRGKSAAQTYATTKDKVQAQMSGWDNYGQVGYKAYYDDNGGTWRMVFQEDEKSLGLKYDFAKDKKLKGVGMWALGFDDGKRELWSLLAEKFGQKLADSSVSQKTINDLYSADIR